VPQPPEASSRASAALPSEPALAGESASVLRLYLREIGQVKLLSREEETALARRVQRGDEEAREQMIKANLRLVVKIAHDYEDMGLPLLDLISEGNLGLMKAVDRFDPAKGAKLSVYAALWIKQCIRRALSNHARTIRVPVYVYDKLLVIHRAALQLQEVLGRDPTHEEIAQHIGLPAGRVQRMRESIQPPVSLDQPFDAPGEKSVAETVPDEQATAPDEALAKAVSLQLLQQHLARLSPREQTVLRHRFGLHEETERTLQELGQEFGLTREGVRQIQNRALAKLRKHFEEQDRPSRMG
jgi:RNA polymerase primary sigma factor